MATTFASLGLEHLSEDDKWLLVLDHRDELEVLRGIPGGFATMDEFYAELDRREAEADADPDGWRNWDEVYAETKQRLARMYEAIPTSAKGEK